MVNEPLSAFCADGLKRIRAWLERDCAPEGENGGRGRYLGASVLVATGEGEWFAGAGERRSQGDAPFGRDAPFARDTLARVFSMTKPVVSLAFAQAMEEGLVHLDAPVSHFLPGWDAMRTADGHACATPTLHQLLLHTSGLSYGFNPGPVGRNYRERAIAFGPEGPDDLAATVDRLAGEPLLFPPGERWHYSVGIDVIGRVLEVIRGRPLDRILREDVFAPLGMEDTFFAVPDEKMERLADCWVLEDGRRRLFDAGAESAWAQGRVRRLSGGGGLVSTVDDVRRFAFAVMGWGSTPLVSPATSRFMRSNHLPGDIASMGEASFAEVPMRGVGFGLGGAVVLDPGRMGVPGSAGDWGWGGMASTYFWIDPVHAFMCVFFTQLVPSGAYPTRAELKALVHGALVE